MKCPFCGTDEDKVIDSRAIKENVEIRRRRECLKCSGRFTTYERIEEMMPFVIKKSGEREPFDRNKIKKGILTSCEKRTVSVEQIEEIIRNIEKTVQDLDKKEVASSRIGEEVMRNLKQLDKVAYIRFASVYKEFKDVDEFIDQVKELGKEKDE